MGNYQVSAQNIFSKFFVQKKEIEPDGTEKVTSIPIKRSRRNVLLVHATTGDSLSFSSYRSRGEARYKDSRVKSSTVMLAPILGEMVRLLEIDTNQAKHLLLEKEEPMISVADLTKLNETETEAAKLVEAAIDAVIKAGYEADTDAKAFTVQNADLEKIPGFNTKVRNAVTKLYTDNKWKVELTPATMIVKMPGKSRGCPKGGWPKKKAAENASVANDSAGSTPAAPETPGTPEPVVVSADMPNVVSVVTVEDAIENPINPT